MLDRARAIQDQLVAWRRDIHQHPELGFEETRTAALVAGELRALGYRVRTGVGKTGPSTKLPSTQLRTGGTGPSTKLGTGVVGERGAGGPVIAIRADMDALPIQEENDVPYASQTPGVMHACGHDAHTAIALGAATLLAEADFPGTVRFLFQPAEEISDEEGFSGAERMVQDGAMDGVEAVLGLHTDASAAAGTMSVIAGPTSAGVDTFWLTVLGQGSHGAYPHRGRDPIHLAGHVILALHGIVSRRISPFDPAVITVGSIQGGQASNVIPEKVELIGTIRYQDPDVQDTIHAEIERAASVARSMGGDYELRIQEGAPPVINDERLVALIREVAEDLLGSEHIRPWEMSLGGEDFSVLAQQAPGAMFRLGCRIEDDERTGHNPRFDIDEDCLPVGAAILAETALRLLRAGR